MDKYLGKKLDGRYEIQELIGSGGMANVYKALDHLNGGTVAVKILKDELLDNEELVRRFKNESKAIGLLSHPNIVKVYDVNFSDQVQYIAMEYVDGITLKDFISRQHQLSWKDTVFFTMQVLKALQHAHDHGIIHRDIKPQNIMITADGSIKVMDFGIARFSRSETRTITDKAIGSVHYISPEQAKGDAIAPTADIYSLGVMMYEMLTGCLPFDSDSPVQVAIKQISDTPTGLREIDDSIPEALEEIVLKAMAKDPERRYQSASQMLRDIDEFKRNPSIRFEYKYFSDDSAVRSLDTAAAAAAKPAAERAKKASDTPAKKAGTNVKKKKVRKQRGIFGLAVPVMMGVTLACVIGSLILVYMIFNMGENSIFSEKIDVDLPNFVGQSLESVENNPDYSKFNFTIEEDYNSTYAEGQIYAQSPNPPKTIKEDGDITLYVSLGVEIVTIPDLIGYANGEAVSTLQDMGLVVMIETTADEDYKDNVVIDISPEVGTEVKSGSPITVTINSLTKTNNARVPNLVGSPLQEAIARLNSYGLVMGEITYAESAEPKDTVLSQTLGEGTICPQNTRVGVTVSSGPPEVVDKTITINVAMPYSVGGNTAYVAKAKMDGAGVGSFTGNGNTLSWSFKVTSKDTHKIVISADGVVLHTITVDFNGPSVTGSSKGSDASIVWDKPAESHTHSFTASYTSNNDGTHTAKCTGCEETETQTCNTAGEGGKCSLCGYQPAPSHTHSDANHDGVCDGCGATGLAVSHSYAMTDLGNGNHGNKCTVCGAVESETAHADGDANGACDTCGASMG